MLISLFLFVWLVLCVVAKQTATTHSHVCLTLGVVEKTNSYHTFLQDA